VALQQQLEGDHPDASGLRDHALGLEAERARVLDQPLAIV
jgi:hypothetical protein